MAGAKASGVVCFQAEVGLMISLYGKQRGFTSLSEGQGAMGAFCDSCYNGEGLVGSARWADVRKGLEVREIQGER